MNLAHQIYSATNHQTERLNFRNLNLDDVLWWQTFMHDKNATALFPDDYKYPAALKSLQWVERQICRYRDEKGGLLAVIETATNQPIGQCGLLLQSVDDETFWEVGYHFLPQFWHRGFATEAANYFGTFALKKMNCPHVSAIIDDRNIASQKVASKIGFKIEKTLVWHGNKADVFRLKK